MAIVKLIEFAKTGAKNTDDLSIEFGFPVAQKPARQWFNWLFNSLTVKINELIDEAVSIRNDTDDKLGLPEHILKPGMTLMWPSATVPSGYLECAGQAVSRTTYSALFAVIGTSFGAGNGTTTFALPDMRGEFVRGWDNGRAVDAGRVLGSSQTELFKSHNHGASTDTSGNHNHATKVGGDNNSPRDANPNNAITMSSVLASSGSVDGSGQLVDAGGHTHNITIDANGGTETRPRNVAWMFIIKL